MNAVLWDLDDTLLDTLPARMRALAHAYALCVGGTTDPIALWRSHRGGTLEDLGRRLVGNDYRGFTTAYRDCYYASNHDAHPYPGVVGVLEGFLRAGVPMAVVTSKVSWGATEELARAGVLGYFAAVVGFDDTERHKPDPEPLYTALDRLCIDDGGGVLVVGDSPADIWAARNAGCVAVGALWGTLDEDLLREANPDLIAATPVEVGSLREGERAARGGPWR